MTEPGCALVTGGSRGIGAACAVRLARSGWPVAVNYRSNGKGADEIIRTIESEGGRAVTVGADVSVGGEVERLFSQVEDELGPIRILVNNAGVRADALTVRMTEEDWLSVLQTNLSAAYLTCRRALMPMVRSRFGRIVNVASVVGPNIGNPGQINYGAAKAGLVGLTRCMAREVARKGVTVNAVAPGFVQTEMTSDVELDFIRGVPAKRAGTPEDVAACVDFLASKDASYVTGTVLTVDGGLTA